MKTNQHKRQRRTFTRTSKRADQVEVGEITGCKKSGRYAGVSIGRDYEGFFVLTHRARSKSYPHLADIPVKTIAWIKSTG